MGEDNSEVRPQGKRLKKGDNKLDGDDTEEEGKVAGSHSKVVGEEKGQQDPKEDPCLDSEVEKRRQRMLVWRQQRMKEKDRRANSLHSATGAAGSSGWDPHGAKPPARPLGGKRCPACRCRG